MPGFAKTDGMTTRLQLAISALLLATALPAQADIFKCVGSDGHVTYANVGGKHCKRLTLDPVPPPAPRPAAKPAAPQAATPANFPKVEESAQRSRDNDRRRILENELASEQRNLDQAKKELAEQEAVRNGDERNYQKVIDRLQPFKDRVALHERNVEAIRNEIARLR